MFGCILAISAISVRGSIYLSKTVSVTLLSPVDLTSIQAMLRWFWGGTRISANVWCLASPTKKWGEAVYAAVELHDGATTSAANIIEFVKQQLDSVKAQKTVHITLSLPRSPVGKVLRRAAKDLFAQGG